MSHTSPCSVEWPPCRPTHALCNCSRSFMAPTATPLFAGLAARHAQLRHWVQSGMPKGLWLGGLQDAAGLLMALKLEVCCSACVGHFSPPQTGFRWGWGGESHPGMLGSRGPLPQGLRSTWTGPIPHPYHHTPLHTTLSLVALLLTKEVFSPKDTGIARVHGVVALANTWHWPLDNESKKACCSVQCLLLKRSCGHWSKEPQF